MFDLKVINSVLSELEEERGIPKEKVLEAIESALATAYKKEYGKRGQIVRAEFDHSSGGVEFFQVKIVVDDSTVKVVELDEEGNEIVDESEADEVEGEEEDLRMRYNPEQHIFIDDARKIKKDAELDEEIIFPLEKKDDYGRIAAQTAKQVIIQKIREAEKVSVVGEFGEKQGTIVSGTVQRVERGSIFVDLGRAVGIIGWDDQIPGERFRQGERIRALLYLVEEGGRGVFLRLSRSHPDFLKELFKAESPEVATGVVEITTIAREPGSRSKVAVFSNDPNIDPVGSLVGQRGVRVSTVMSELGGEKIDIIEWSDSLHKFIEDSLSPATVLSVEIDEDEGKAFVEVTSDQQSLAIGKGGQNVRLAAKLTGWKIEIHSIDEENEEGEEGAEGEEGTDVTDEYHEELEETFGGDHDNELSEVEQEALEDDGEHAFTEAVDPDDDSRETIDLAAQAEDEAQEEDLEKKEGAEGDTEESNEGSEDSSEEESE